MSRASVSWTVAGLLSSAAALVGAAGWMTGSVPNQAPSGWLPPCARQLGPTYAELDVSVRNASSEGPVMLLGVDRSPSNRDQSGEQLRLAVDLAKSLSVDHGVGILFVSDRSDRSSTPDLPYEAPQPRMDVELPALPCGECEADSLFEQKCIEQVREALEARGQRRSHALEEARDEAHARRSVRLETWHERVSEWWPRPGSSILGFWRKVADLPPTRRDPESVTVVLLGDLQEARTPDRRAVERYAARVARAETCIDGNPLAARLDGVNVVLLQTVVDGIDAPRWGTRWETVLECAGAHTTRYRYTPSVPLTHYLSRSLKPRDALETVDDGLERQRR